ncbi:hypothetical protein [Burkholderia stagnalis]|uniref:hypothetical protein n=1 Tax=Burkholderia stagnalis TaxID=1503054 RepID=UPI0012D9E0F6|nr:hypothetical protein [Burkholderia stagnalis]
MFQIDDECLAILIALRGIVLSDTAIAGPAADLARSPTRTKPMRETRSAHHDASHRGIHLPRRNDMRIAADFFARRTRARRGQGGGTRRKDRRGPAKGERAARRRCATGRPRVKRAAHGSWR